MSIILLIEERLFVRHCVHDCFDRSYPDHEIVAFGSLAEWRDSPERKNLKPAVLIYFVATGLGQLTKSEFERLEALAPNVPVVVISDSASSDEIERIIGYGARGYIPTSMPYFIAVEAVRFIEAGGTFVPAGNLLADRGQYQPTGSKALTERQMKVAEAVGHGFANKQIAYQLKMSENTVKVHLRHIMKKLNVKNRTEIAIVTQRLLNGAGEYSRGKPPHSSTDSYSRVARPRTSPHFEIELERSLYGARFIAGEGRLESRCALVSSALGQVTS